VKSRFICQLTIYPYFLLQIAVTFTIALDKYYAVFYLIAFKFPFMFELQMICSMNYISNIEK